MNRKIFALFAFVFCAGTSASFCQEFVSNKLVTTYFDYNWRPTNNQHARYYSVAMKTDSGWFRGDYYVIGKKLQMLGLYEDKESKIRNGSFTWYYPDGRLKSTTRYIHDKSEGLSLEFYADGSLKDSTVYHNGKPTGTSFGWYLNGQSSFTFTVDTTGKGVYTSWFDSGQPSSAGRYIDYNIPHGRWQYFHKSGKVSAVELYNNGELTDKQYFDESGSPVNDTTLKDHDAVFPGGPKAWDKFLDNNLHFPSYLDFKSGYTAAVVLNVTIGEDGKVSDIEVTLPLHPEFDKIAVNGIKNSPVWIPAVSHNRHVPYSFKTVIAYSRNYVEY